MALRPCLSTSLPISPKKIVPYPPPELSFDNSLTASQNARSYVQTIDQVRCEPFKTTAKFQWFWILYVIISFFSYTRTAIQITTGVYVVRYWMIICAFSDRRFRKKQTLVCQVTNKLNERVEKTGGGGPQVSTGALLHMIYH